VVEDELMNLRRLLQMGEEERLFLCTIDDLAQQEKQHLIEEIGRLREHLLHVKALFSLKSRGEEPSLDGKSGFSLSRSGLGGNHV
jgi:hypothetical protein